MRALSRVRCSMIAFGVSACFLATQAFCDDKTPPQTNAQPTYSVWLETLDLRKVEQERGRAQAAKSVDGNAIKIGGVEFPHGIGTHARSRWRIGLNGAATQFSAMVGIDDETNNEGSVEFQVWVDGRRVAETGVVRGGEKARPLEADLTGAKEMVLVVTNGGDDIVHDHADSAYPHPANYQDHADWAMATLTLKPGGAKPESLAFPPVPPPVLADNNSPLPAINGPRSRRRHARQSVLVPDSRHRRTAAQFRREKSARRSQTRSQDRHHLRLVAARRYDRRRIAGRQRPGPGKAKADDRRRQAQAGPDAADGLELLELLGRHRQRREDPRSRRRDGQKRPGRPRLPVHQHRRHAGEAKRDKNGEIQRQREVPRHEGPRRLHPHQGAEARASTPRPARRPAPATRRAASTREQDAKTWAKWGVDYLKYDWCSYGRSPKHESRRCDEALPDACARPSTGATATSSSASASTAWATFGSGAREVGGNCWRTTGDINDSWGSMSGIGFNQDEHGPLRRPGHWNDRDMLVVGKVGWGESHRRPTNLTAARAGHAHHALVPAGRAAADRLRHDGDGRVHAPLLTNPEVHRRRSGSRWAKPPAASSRTARKKSGHGRCSTARRPSACSIAARCRSLSASPGRTSASEASRTSAISGSAKTSANTGTDLKPSCSLTARCC